MKYVKLSIDGEQAEFNRVDSVIIFEGILFINHWMSDVFGNSYLNETQYRMSKITALNVY